MADDSEIGGLIGAGVGLIGLGMVAKAAKKINFYNPPKKRRRKRR